MKSFIILTGPTGVGKTKLSLALGHAINGAIVSADSMQVYKGMDIGTDKISLRDQEGLDHYGLDIRNPNKGYSVADFQKDFLSYKKNIQAQGKNILVVGGTGLYLHSLMYQLDFGKEEKDPKLRASLEEIYKYKGNKGLVDLLKREDSRALSKVDLENPQRLIRAIELAKAGKSKKDEFNKLREDLSPLLIILYRDRQDLYDRINQRVDTMLDQGLVQEVEGLRARGLKRDDQAMKAIGYKEVYAYLEGDLGYEEMVALVKRNSRRYAKRQLTWFRRYPQAHWINLNSMDQGQALEEILRQWRMYNDQD